MKQIIPKLVIPLAQSNAPFGRNASAGRSAATGRGFAAWTGAMPKVGSAELA